MNFGTLSISQIQSSLKEKKFSATELLEFFLGEIKKKEKDIHAFLEVSEDVARAQAKALDENIAKKQKLPLLAGIPCAVKDAIMVEGVHCTAGSNMLKDYIAPYDATVIKKIKEAGALIVGKTNMDEFGMGGSTENSAFGPTKNPNDLSRVPGGSSGGAAASVAAGESLVSLGEDTGGSIRLPAAFCGVVGLKPTYGAVSRYGIISLASSLDQVGPLARNVQDSEVLFNVIRGKDPLDSTSVELEIFNPPARRAGFQFSISTLRIGVPKEYFAKGLDPEIEKVIQGTIKRFETTGAKIVEIELPHTKYALATYCIINMSEASSNLARYDGLRYGYNSKIQSPKPRTQNLQEEYFENRGEGFGAEVKRRIMLGTYALSAGYYDAYYSKAQKIRTLLKQDFDKAFETVDIIAGPVSPFLPFKIGERVQDPLAMYLVDVYTVPVNLAGLPAMSLPVGKVGSLPVGLQLIAPPFCENILFETGKAIEKL